MVSFSIFKGSESQIDQIDEEEAEDAGSLNSDKRNDKRKKFHSAIFE